MIEIDLDRAKALVNECIKERGEDFVYEKEDSESSCLYVHGVNREWDEDQEEYTILDFNNATPGCLVGAALHKAGVPLDKMGDARRNESGSYDLIRDLELRDELVKVSEHAVNYFANAQASQDAGAPWGMASEAAAKGQTLQPNRDDETGMKTGKFDALSGDPVV
jgi:hypothetical protein